MCQVQHPDKWYEAMGEITGYRGRNQHFTPGTHRYWQCNCETVMFAVPFSGMANLSIKEALAARVVETQTQEETKPLKDCKGEAVINYSDGKGYLANEVCDMCGAVRPDIMLARRSRQAALDAVNAQAWKAIERDELPTEYLRSIQSMDDTGVHVASQDVDMMSS